MGNRTDDLYFLPLFYHPLFVIALHSPSGLAETGLPVCGPGEDGCKTRLSESVGHFLQSVFEARIAELRHFQVTFRGMQGIYRS
jgi:hypothetical protein